MELLRECLLNKMPVNQGDAAGQWRWRLEDALIKSKILLLTGNTALHWAARAGHMDIISALLAVPQVAWVPQYHWLSNSGNPLLEVDIIDFWLFDYWSETALCPLALPTVSIWTNLRSNRNRGNGQWQKMLFFQVQLNTSNKLGETPIKTAAMAGKVNQFQTTIQLSRGPLWTIELNLKPWLPGRLSLYQFLFQPGAVQKLLEAGAKTDSLGKVTDPEVRHNIISKSYSHKNVWQFSLCNRIFWQRRCRLFLLCRLILIMLSHTHAPTRHRRRRRRTQNCYF